MTKDSKFGSVDDARKALLSVVRGVRGKGSSRLPELVVVAGVLAWMTWGGGNPPAPSRQLSPAPANASQPVAAAKPAPVPQAEIAASKQAMFPIAPPAASATPPDPKGPVFADRRSLVQTPAAAPEPAKMFGDRRGLVDVRPPAPKRDAIAAAPPSSALTITPRTLPFPVSNRIDPACAAPEIATEPGRAGTMRIEVQSACRKGQAIVFVYDGIEIRREIPADGGLVFVLDCFAGDRKSVDIVFADGMRRVLPVTAGDLDKVTKVAVRWRSPVNLDLHAFEHATAPNSGAHVFEKAPSAAEAALATARESRRGRGFLSTIDDGQNPGDKLEVYTYVHGETDPDHPVALALDHETRGELPAGPTCGQGALARVEFSITMLSPRGSLVRANGVMKPARCGEPIAIADRLDQALMPVIVTNR